MEDLKVVLKLNMKHNSKKNFQLPEDICQYSDTGEVHDATYYRLVPLSL